MNNESAPVDGDVITPTDDQIIDAIIDNLFIRGIDFDSYRHEFSNERSGIPDAIRKLFAASK